MIIDDFMDCDGGDAKNGISWDSMTKKKKHLFTLVEINNTFQFSRLRQQITWVEDCVIDGQCNAEDFL